MRVTVAGRTPSAAEISRGVLMSRDGWEYSPPRSLSAGELALNLFTGSNPVSAPAVCRYDRFRNIHNSVSVLNFSRRSRRVTFGRGFDSRPLHDGGR